MVYARSLEVSKLYWLLRALLRYSALKFRHDNTNEFPYCPDSTPIIYHEFLKALIRKVPLELMTDDSVIDM